VLRRAFRRWLDRLGWPRTSAEELVLALNEAVSNSVEHAYSQVGLGQHRPVWVRAELVMPPDERAGRCQVVLDVRDAGRWRPPPSDPGHRGRGLAMMRALAAGLDVEPGRGGTRVRMVSQRARPAASAGCARTDQALRRHTAPRPAWSRESDRPSPSARRPDDDRERLGTTRPCARERAGARDVG
jgi:anti-sigma regulatory factor (Ser/Thr protein kinase)